MHKKIFFIKSFIYILSIVIDILTMKKYNYIQ